MSKKGGAMPVEDLIREHRKFGKRLGAIGFTVSSKGRQIIVKFGKKLNIIECPTIEAAQSLADGFNATIQSRATQIEEFITLMEANCQQLSLFVQPKKAVPVKKEKDIFDKIMDDVDAFLLEPIEMTVDGMLTGEAPVPEANPFEGLDETPDHHQE
jgi:hypothetical protein